MSETFTITLVQSKIKDRPYTKTDGKYAGPTWINDIGLQTVKIDLNEVHGLFSKLQKIPLVCMVYGEAIRERIPSTDRTMKNFRENTTHLITFDLDDYRTPNLKRCGADVTYNQVVEDADYFIERNLPPDFHNASYILRFSSSFLLKEDGRLRAHLIFISERPQFPREIGLWMRQLEMPADPTFYLNLTQPVFTAAPQFFDTVDPFAVREDYFPRISIVRKATDVVEGEWLPLSGEHFSHDAMIKKLPSVTTLTGKVGSFCRRVQPESILHYLGYSSDSKGRFLAPTSETGLPGTIVFDNGYMYSHHSEDPINKVIDKIYHYRRRSLNVHDLMHGWATLQMQDNPKVMSEYEYLMGQAIAEDQTYQNEIQDELMTRCDWLTPDGFTGLNKQIVTGIVQDASALGMVAMSQNTLAAIIADKTAIRKTDVMAEFKNLRRERAFNNNRYDPDANLRHMADIFKGQQILYAQHGTLSGDYWCYYKDLRLWRRRNQTQTEAFIYKHVHEAIPSKMEIDFSKTEKLTRLILRQACEDALGFSPGAGWAFKDGKYGIIMNDLFQDKDWDADASIRTLQKADHIYKVLPITYRQWQESKEHPPEKFMTFLETTCEEDYEVMNLIQEYGGYIMGDSYYLHRFLIIEGLPGSGKSLLGGILRECVGPQFFVASSISSIGSRFGLGGMGGKKLVMMSEARSVDFATLKAAVPILLKITGNDYLDTEAKLKSSLTERLEAKILILTNRLPVLPDDTGALAQRVLMLRFNKVFRGTKHEILGLEDILVREELAGIIRFFMQGLANLSKRKGFLEPSEGPSAQMKYNLLQQIDPLKSFMTSYFDVREHEDRDLFISQNEFLKFFRAYCYRLNQNTDKKLIRRRASIRHIQTLEPTVDKKRLKRSTDTGTSQPWLLFGLVPKIELEFEFAQEIIELNTTEVD
jgi:hypothetical protein